MIKKLTDSIKHLLKENKKSTKESSLENLENSLQELYSRYEKYESAQDKDSIKKCKAINKLIIKVQNRIKEIKELS